MPLPHTSHRLFERTWRSSCPIRPRHSRLRRWAGLALLAVLGSLIFGYIFITDSTRVREQAESYLSRLVGGPVHVESASLSLFEGLRLEGVRILTPAEPGEPAAPDATLFTARSVRIDYNPVDLLLGNLSATRVIAVDPTVRLTEDIETETWNFQRLERRRRTGIERPETPGTFAPPEELPEVLLRNAQVEYARRYGPTLVPRGSVGIEAQLTPRELGGEAEYRFAVQTRGLAGAGGDAGPRASGTINLTGGRAEARLQDVDFGALFDMFPRVAADFLRRHAVTGRMDVPMISIDWDNLVSIRGPGGTMELVPQFRVEVRLDGAQVQGLPEQWLPEEELAARLWTVQTLQGLRDRLPERRRGGKLEAALDHLIAEGTPRPLRLSDVSGRFMFTEAGLRVNGLVGSFEGHRLRVDGIVNGYHPDAGLSLVVRNAESHLNVDNQVPYVSSLPRQVREIYDRFLPMGQCRLRLELHRPEADADGTDGRPIITGNVDVLDGTFTLDRFPYPIRSARGRLLLRYDRETQQDQLLIEDLRGRGIAGGPNEDALISVNGLVGPLTSVAGFDITVAGKDVRNEPALLEALPPEARQAIANFDHTRHGKGVGFDGGPPPLLSFGGDFSAHVLRPPGRNQRWGFRVDLFLKEVNGAFVGFPYPLANAQAEVSVFPSHLEIRHAQMTRPVAATDLPADASPSVATVDFRGRVEWGRREGDPPGRGPPVRVDLSVAGDDLPTDAALLGALPPESARQIQALGVGGRADVTARVFTDDADEMRWDVALDLTDGRFWPATGTFSLSGATGRVRVLPEQVELTDVVGRRGEGTIRVNGTVGLTANGETRATVSARNVTLDAAVYELLPTAARNAWDWLQPAGQADAEVFFRGPTALLLGEGDFDPAMAEYDVTLRPQGLRVLPRGFPYAMQEVRGSVRIIPGHVELAGITATHALDGDKPPVRLSLAGRGDLGAGEDGADLWQLRPVIEGAPVDDALLSALPEKLAETVQSLKVAGTIGAEFRALDITAGGEPAAAGTLGSPSLAAQGEPATPTTSPVDTPLDVAFDVTLTAAGVATDVGVPLADVRGRLDLAGTYEDGELHEISGTFDASSFSVTGRPGSALRGTIALPPGSRTLSIDNLSAEVAGGQLGGGVTLTFGEDPEDPAHFAVTMAVREADVRKLVGERNGRPADFGGHLTARLDVEGTFGDVTTRRGRGEVIVEGQKLYDLPLVLGLLQVTNLAMPVTEPFREATATFSVDGPQIVFDRIALRAADMTMNGEGTLNFQTQKVDLAFTTSSHRWAQVPLLGDIVGLARNELLRIHVRGTLQSPEVSGSTLPTVTSTIDEVFRRK